MQLLPLLAWALLPGCGAVKGPGTVWGYLGGSLSVTCTYQPGQETLPKFWCQRGLVYTCGTDLVITSESEPVVRQGRFSIRDNRTCGAFTVTVERLSERDTGIFRCGVRTGKLRSDESDDVKVILYPAAASSTSATSTTSKLPDLTSSVTHPTQTIHQGETEQSTSNPSTPQPLNVVEHVLTPAIIVVLLLLAVAAGVLVILSRKRKKATSMLHPALSRTAIEMDRTRSVSPTGTDVVSYADINHDLGTAESEYSNVKAFCHQETPTTVYMEVRQSAQPSEEDTEPIYAKVQKPVPQQEQIYSNVPSAPPPSEELYSTVWGR